MVVVSIWPLIALAVLVIGYTVASGVMTFVLLRRTAQQAAYDADMYAQVGSVIDDLISISPEKAEPLEVARLEMTEAERKARRRARRTTVKEMLTP